MRWSTDALKTGDAKWTPNFALLPVECDDGVTVWFEPYYTKLVYCTGEPDYGWGDSTGPRWKVVKTLSLPPKNEL